MSALTIDDYLIAALCLALPATLAPLARLEAQPTSGTYLAVGTVCLGMAIRIVLKASWRRSRLIGWDLIALMPLAAWAYGAVVGVLYGRDDRLIVRNFFGMTLYATYFLTVLLGPDRRRVARFVLASSAIAAGLCLALLVSGLAPTPLSAFGRKRMMMSELQVHALVCIPCFLEMAQSGPDATSKRIGFVGAFSVILAAVVSAFSLAMTSFVLFATGLFVARGWRRWRIPLTATVAVLIVMTAVEAYLLLEGRLYSMFLPAEGVRSTQAWYLIRDFDLAGHGLGAALSNGFVRDLNLSYAYEITPLNLIHKLGLIALLPLIAIAVPLWRSSAAVLDRRATVAELVAVGYGVFVCMGLANPALYSPSAVVVHSLVLYSMRPLPAGADGIEL